MEFVVNLGHWTENILVDRTLSFMGKNMVGLIVRREETLNALLEQHPELVPVDEINMENYYELCGPKPLYLSYFIGTIIGEEFHYRASELRGYKQYSGTVPRKNVPYGFEGAVIVFFL